MRRGMFGVKARFWGENFVVSNGARGRVALTASDYGGRPRCSLTGLLVAKLVADAPNGQHHLRILRIVFNLRSQAIDV
jgi:hypothetical protein